MNKMSQKGVQKQNGPHQNIGVISGAPEVESDSAPHMAPVVLHILLQSR